MKDQEAIDLFCRMHKLMEISRRFICKGIAQPYADRLSVQAQ